MCVVTLLSKLLGFLAPLTALWLGTIQRTHSLCHSPYRHVTVLYRSPLGCLLGVRPAEAGTWAGREHAWGRALQAL
jgi:hypothetical protein